MTGTRVEGERSTIVSSTIDHPNGGPPDTVDWRVQNTPAGYKIADVDISGISMAIEYRDQFAAVIDRNGGQVAALIPALREKLGQPSGSSSVGPQTKEASP